MKKLKKATKGEVLKVFTIKNFYRLTIAGALCLIGFWQIVIWRNPKSDFHMAAIVQTLVFAMGLFFTNVSLQYLAKSNNFTKELLNIERKRDLQANLICAWLPVEVRPVTERDFLNGIAVFMNASPLPVYDVSFKIMYLKDDSLVELNPLVGSKGFVTPVVSPTKDPRPMWVIEGIRDNDNSGERIRSIDFFSVEKQYTNFFSPQTLNIAEMELSTMTIEISFRCVDGSKWKRLTSGKLCEVFD